jgi:hypothetical protein
MPRIKEEEKNDRKEYFKGYLDALMQEGGFPKRSALKILEKRFRGEYQRAFVEE